MTRTYAQNILDSCFGSVEMRTFQEICNNEEFGSDLIVGANWGICEWIDGEWVASEGFSPLFLKKQTPDSGILHKERGIYLGASCFGEEEEFVAFKLDSELKVGEAVEVSVTYVSNYFKKKGASQHGSLDSAGYEWKTSLFSFAVSRNEKGHKWLIFDVTDMSQTGQQGMILNFCSRLSLDSKKVEEQIVFEEVASNSVSSIVDLKEDESMEIRNLHFKTGTANLLEESIPILENLYYTLNQFSNLYIEIVGHTDNVGSKEYNQVLSNERAKYVQYYLINKGIAVERLNVSGRGGSEPVATNETESGRQANRRVELVLIQK